MSNAVALRLVLASANPDKSVEIAEILHDTLGETIELLPRPTHVPIVEEDGATLLENARLKAHSLLHATGLSAVSDDTGLEVDALNGAPGVYTARYAGLGATYEQNVTKLLAALRAESERSAAFRSVAYVAFADGTDVFAEGVVHGVIAEAARGEAGFGYDPIFVPDGGDGRTFAEMTPSEKHRFSHRGEAFRKLALLVGERLARSPQG